MVELFGRDDFGRKIERDESAEVVRHRNKRHKLGRYELEEAAVMVDDAGEARADQLLDALMKAAEVGDIPMYEPGLNDHVVYGPKNTREVRQFHEHAYWHDLNTWLDKNRPKIKYRFPDPDLIANSANVDGLREVVCNGGPIDWKRWAALSNITASQAAKLANGIDPFVWPSDTHFAQGPMQKELREKIEFLTQWLEDRSVKFSLAQKWSLAQLCDALGESTPLGTLRAVNARVKDTQVTKVPAYTLPGHQSNADNPPPLTTRDLAAAFDGCDSRNAAKWRKLLSNVPTWTTSALVSRGSRGGDSSTWNPVKFAGLLRARGTVDDGLKRLFRDKTELSPWKGQWASSRSVFGEYGLDK